MASGQTHSSRPPSAEARPSSAAWSFDEERLTALISLYRDAIEQLKAAGASADTAFDACLLRDQIGVLIDRIGSETTFAQTIRTLQHDDDRLTDALQDLFSRCPPEQFLKYRRTRNPARTAWWWHCLDDEQTSIGRDPLYRSITVIALVFALVIALVIALRLSRTPAALTDLSTYLQVITPLLVGSAFTNLGKQFGDLLVQLFHVPPRRKAGTRMALGLGLLAAMIALFFSLPWQATQQNNQGRSAFDRGEMLSALDSFQRAVSMNPGYATAYYNLANTYNELNRSDEAIAAYQQALEHALPVASQSTSTLVPSLTWFAATNNMAQLLTLSGDRQGAATAIAVLNRAILYDTPETASEIRSALYRNRALANLNVGLYSSAKKDLERTQAINPDSPITACVAGMFFEDNLNPFRNDASALQAWITCLGATPDDHVPAIWIAIAQDHYWSTP